MSILDGWANWSIAHFNKFFFADEELVFDFLINLKYPNVSSGATMRNLAGTNIHQGMWLGGDAPINLSPMEGIDMEFHPDSESETYLIQRMVSLVSLSPQSMFCGIWHEDIWYIPTGAGITEWQTSRSLPFDLVDIEHVSNDFLPKAFIDNTAQAIITAGSPADGEVYIEPGVESAVIVTPELSAGTYLRLLYPAKIMIGRMEITASVPATDDYRLSISIDEHLPTRSYNFSIP